MADFYINVQEGSIYPTSDFSYNPDNKYPEYKWSNSEISKEKNAIYEMVRNCLIGLELDVKNYNSKDWNPLGEFIKKGDTVLIKPNWVMHKNENKTVTEFGLECLITHPSIVRAVTDYCIIALGETGHIIIGDAPMQGCDLERLLDISGYRELFRFYNQHSFKLLPTDFRKFSVGIDKNKVISTKKYNSSEGLKVVLNSKSKLNRANFKMKKFKVSDYNEKITNEYHNGSNHIYLINKDVLSADVIINLCKPKCHRLAGITGALKNMVGITYDKACLPHRTNGSIQQGGDEYIHNSIVKKMISKVLDQKIAFEEKKKYSKALIMRFTYGILYYLMKGVSKDPYLIGSWYGNDTIWRTVLDLYHIILYANKDGIVCENKQRKVFNLADMIIAGEKNGPISPEPKKLGIIVAGNDAVIIDRLICDIMGFDFKKIPTIYNAINDIELNQKEIEKFLFYSNLSEYNNKRINELHFPQKWSFKPFDTWKRHIEKIIV